MELLYPILRRRIFNIDPLNPVDVVFNSESPFLIIGLQAPEVSPAALAPVTLANLNTYELAVSHYFAGNYQYDKSEIHQPGARTIYYTETLSGAVDPDGKYELTILYLEFNN